MCGKELTRGTEEDRKLAETYRQQDFSCPSVTADIVVFTVAKTDADSYRKLPIPRLRVLLIRRGQWPHRGQFALPGGFVKPTETVDAAACRELLEETGIACPRLEPVRLVSDPNRDVRGWIITNVYLALLDWRQYALRAGTDAADALWCDVSLCPGEKAGAWTLKLANEERGMSYSAELEEYWTWEYQVHPDLRRKPGTAEEGEGGVAFDHALLIAYALLRLREWIQRSPIGFALLPEKFTLTELQQIHETVLDQKLYTAAFRRKIADYVEGTDETTCDAGHRPARLWRRKEQKGTEDHV